MKRRYALTLALFLITLPLFGKQTVLLLRFYNASSFSGDWQIGPGITEMVRERLVESGKYKVIVKNLTTLYGVMDKDKVYDDKEKLHALGTRYGADIIVNGIISTFSLSTYGLVSPGLGGVKYYNSSVKMNIRISQVVSGTVKHIEAKALIHDADLGVTILGGPGGSEDLGDETLMERLQKVRFGSEVFRKTLVGRATIAAIDDLMTQLDTHFPAERERLDAKVILIEEGFVYVNIGYDGGIKEGTKFLIYREGSVIKDPETGEVLGKTEKNVAEIEVVLVQTKKLSKARIVKEYTDIKKGDMIRFMKTVSQPEGDENDK